MSSVPELAVAEIVGPTVSGEGPTTGQRCGLIRLRECDLLSDPAPTPVSDIVSAVVAMKVGFVIISGGEPLLQQSHPGWSMLLGRMRHHGIGIDVETTGTVAPSASSVLDIRRFLVSPRMAAARRGTEQLRPNVITSFKRTRRAVFVFVCTTADDVAEAEVVSKQWTLDPSAVWVMPEGDDSRTMIEHLSVISGPAVAAGFNISSRLHVFIGENAKGW